MEYIITFGGFTLKINSKLMRNENLNETAEYINGTELGKIYMGMSRFKLEPSGSIYTPESVKEKYKYYHKVMKNAKKDINTIKKGESKGIKYHYRLSDVMKIVEIHKFEHTYL